MKRELKIVRTYPHPRELVWRAITEREALAEWLMETDFEPVVGRRFSFHTKPGPGFDGRISGEVLAADAPALLSYTFTGSMIDTVVTIRLEAVEEGTRLTLEHTGFSGWKGMLVSELMLRGWRKKFTRSIPALLDRWARAA